LPEERKESIIVSVYKKVKQQILAITAGKVKSIYRGNYWG